MELTLVKTIIEAVAGSNAFVVAAITVFYAFSAKRQKKIERLVKHGDIKQSAMNYAIEKSLGNGYNSYYKEKYNQLISETGFVENKNTSQN